MASPATSSSGGGATGESPKLLPMAPLAVPIVGGDRLEGALRLKLMLAAKDEAGLARLTEELPQLRAVTVAGSIEFSRLYASSQTPVDVVQLSKDLTKALRAKSADVAEVLIIEVSTAA